MIIETPRAGRIFIGAEYQSKRFGNFIVNSKVDGFSDKYHITFKETQTKSEAYQGAINRGAVRDKMHPSHYGVGFVGYGSHSANGSNIAYRRWAVMLQRCYSPGWHEKHPTYKDCEVCEEWQEFQAFADWFEENYPKDGICYDLDKDIRVLGNKIYSPETCKFVTREENVSFSSRGENYSGSPCAPSRRKRNTNSTPAYRVRESYSIDNPHGETIYFVGITRFARENNMTLSCLQKLRDGNFSHYRGWTNLKRTK
ncbi:hypothetical protein NVP1029O_08 [Vibrio phage 1.029.O._10N.261.55.A7]|nr:hypothetical protein NVP1029O_08 [Vibrio phage 1.029.O._10N.261.55.A7]